MISNEKMLEVAGNVFNHYSLPDGAEVGVNPYSNEIVIRYVFIDGEGAAEMKQIVTALNLNSDHVIQMSRSLVIDQTLEVNGQSLNFRAQMEIKEPKTEPSPSVIESALNSIGLSS